MDTRTLDALRKAREWSRSELARRVGVSRQAVSLWFRKGPRVALRSPVFLRVAKALGVPAEDLDRPLPCFGKDHTALRATLLWDRLYPDLDDFAIAVNAGHPRAVARLVETYGLYAGARMIGSRAWRDFPEYKRYIHPARRRSLEALWRWRRRRTAG
ncbi:MAG: helix-turn-helix transcriptional regulator [Planctomycetes bacterium]|nr:helix-turn-helix transcriptional regulator [Planctomycetota bacterium]